MPSRTRQEKTLTTKCSKMSTLRLEVSSKSTRTFDTSVIKNEKRSKQCSWQQHFMLRSLPSLKNIYYHYYYYYYYHHYHLYLLCKQNLGHFTFNWLARGKPLYKRSELRSWPRDILGWCDNGPDLVLDARGGAFSWGLLSGDRCQLILVVRSPGKWHRANNTLEGGEGGKIL